MRGCFLRRNDRVMVGVLFLKEIRPDEPVRRLATTKDVVGDYAQHFEEYVPMWGCFLSGNDCSGWLLCLKEIRPDEPVGRLATTKDVVGDYAQHFEEYVPMLGRRKACPYAFVLVVLVAVETQLCVCYVEKQSADMCIDVT